MSHGSHLPDSDEDDEYSVVAPEDHLKEIYATNNKQFVSELAQDAQMSMILEHNRFKCIQREYFLDAFGVDLNRLYLKTVEAMGTELQEFCDKRQSFEHQAYVEILSSYIKMYIDENYNLKDGSE